MTVEQYIVDAEVVGEKQDTASGLRRIVGRVRAALSTADDRDRLGELRADAALVADGVRGRALARRERATLAEYRHNGNPDAEVRADMRTHYERARDRQEKANDAEMSVDDAIRYGAWGTVAVLELVFCAWIVGGLSGWYSGLAVLVAIGNVVGGRMAWRRLRREGRTYRTKRAAWALGNAPSEADAEDDHSAASLTALFAEAGIVRAVESGGQGVSLAEPVASDSRSFTARVVLPGGVTVGHARRKLGPLASALDVYPQQVQISSGESERRLELRVFRELPFTGEAVPSPLIGRQGHSLAAGVPLGEDINGTTVTLSLAKGRHGLVVASSGNGKTVLLLNIASATVLDVSATLTVLDGKPDGAYTGFRALCEDYVTTAQDDPLSRAADALERVCEHMDDRLARADRGETIDGDHVVILDEFQEFTGNLSGGGMGKGEPKPRVRAALDRIARRGRSARMRLVLASQHYDGRTLDDSILTNIGWRAIGYAPSAMSKDALGELGERFGLDTSQTFVDEVQAGAAIVAGGGVHPYRPMRGYLQNPADVTAIVDTAQRLRTATAEAAGTDPAGEPATDTGPEREAAGGTELDESAAALHRAVLAVYGDDDAEWIPTETLMSEVAVGELGYSHDRATSMEIARVLTEAGAYKKKTSEAGPDRPRAWHRPTLVDAARQALGE